MCLQNIMKHCVIAFAILIPEALSALEEIQQLALWSSSSLKPEASASEEIQQLALLPSSSLQLEASSASKEYFQNISDEMEILDQNCETQVRVSHGSAAHTDPRVSHDAASASVHSIMKRIESHPRVRVVSLIVFISIHRDVKTDHCSSSSHCSSSNHRSSSNHYSGSNHCRNVLLADDSMPALCDFGMAAELCDEVAQRWGWTSTCSVLSAIVASQAATEKPVWAPRPSADNGAAGAPVAPRSPLPGTARSREVRGLVGTPYALGQVHVLKRAAWCRLGLF